MQIDTHLILRLEKLSNLQLESSERERFAGDLDKIVAMVNHLQQLDTTGVEPLVYLSDRTNALRDDVIARQLTAAEGLYNAPAHDDRFFRAPKVASKPE
jgi:aspartyl-tRNA(Asn)/glutamyl-tRNA(Gln) amidotransferase subunit C